MNRICKQVADEAGEDARFISDQAARLERQGAPVDKVAGADDLAGLLSDIAFEAAQLSGSANSENGGWK